jgi:hypothetical protein
MLLDTATIGKQLQLSALLLSTAQCGTGICQPAHTGRSIQANLITQYSTAALATPATIHPTHMLWF